MILDRLLGRSESRDGPTIGFDQWAQLVSQFSYQGVQYTTTDQPQEQVSALYAQLGSLAYAENGIVFACMAVRQMLFRQMRFQFRRPRDGASGALFGDTSLRPLERPWPGGTTSDLLGRAITHHDLGGNAFFVGTRAGGTGLLRPDWVDMVIGSNQSDVSAAAWAPDAQVIGYIYHPGGKYSGLDPIVYDYTEVAHWAMYPDPMAQFRGMSWLTPVIREIMADKAMNDHKLKFFENSATPQMVVKVDTPDVAKYEAYIELFKRQREGVSNAYSTMFIGAGVDANVVGANLRQMDFSNVQGAGEVRIAAAAGVPPVIVGLSEGLSGSSLNAGNYTAARRRLTDGTIVPMWQNVCGTLDNIFAPVNGGRLWYDTSDVAFMKEDQQDAASIQATKSTSINTLITAGFEADSIIKAIVADDFTLLVHSGLTSVQLLPPGTPGEPANADVGPNDDPAAPAPTGSTAPAPTNGNGNGRSEFEITDYMLQRLLADVEREKQPAATHIHVTTPDTKVEIADGAFRSDVRLELPASEGPRTEFAEGAFQTHVQIEPSPTDIRVEPTSVTVEPTSVNVEPAEVRVDANITVEPSNVTVEPVSVTVEPADVRMAVEEGAIHVGVEMPDVQVDVAPADVRMSMEEGAVQVNVEPPDVHVEVEMPPLELNVDVRAAEQAAPVIQVQPTPIVVENQIDVQQPNKTIQFLRDADGNIVEASSEDTDATEDAD